MIQPILLHDAALFLIHEKHGFDWTMPDQLPNIIDNTAVSRDFRLIYRFLMNAIDAGLLPYKKTSKSKSQFKRNLKKLGLDIKVDWVPDKVFDYWVTLGDLAKYVSNPENTFENEEANYPHSREALAKCLWLLIQKDRDESEQLKPGEVSEELEQIVSDLEEDQRITAAHGLSRTTITGCGSRSARSRFTASKASGCRAGRLRTFRITR